MTGQPRRESESTFVLARENNQEFWLDLATGLIHTAPVEPEEMTMAAPNFELQPDVPLNDLFPFVERAMADLNWSWVPLGDEGLRFNCSTRVALYELLVGTSARRREVVCYCVVPVRVPAEQRILAAELLSRINYGLRLGNFELDFRDGEIRYKTSIDVADVLMNAEIVRGLMSTAMTICDLYFSAIQRVLFAGVSPEDAVRETESR